MLLAALQGLKLTFTIISPSKYGYNSQFRAKNVMEDEYFIFIMYVAEYQSMVLEQLTYDSHKVVTTIPISTLNKDFGGTGRNVFVFDSTIPGLFVSLAASPRHSNATNLSTATAQPVSIMRQKSTASSTSSTTAEGLQKRPKLLSAKSILRVLGFSRGSSTSTSTMSDDNHSVTGDVPGSPSSRPIQGRSMSIASEASSVLGGGGEGEGRGRMPGRRSIQFA